MTQNRSNIKCIQPEYSNTWVHKTRFQDDAGADTGLRWGAKVQNV